jgi:hypothetical protein
MKLIGAAFCVAAVCAVGLGAQTSQTETKTKIKQEHGENKETHGKSEVSGDLANLPYLGVRSVKMIAASCP